MQTFDRFVMSCARYWPSGGTSGRTLVGGPGFGAPTYDGPGEQWQPRIIICWLQSSFKFHKIQYEVL